MGEHYGVVESRSAKTSGASNLVFRMAIKKSDLPAIVALARERMRKAVSDIFLSVMKKCEK